MLRKINWLFLSRVFIQGFFSKTQGKALPILLIKKMIVAQLIKEYQARTDITRAWPTPVHGVPKTTTNTNHINTNQPERRNHDCYRRS
jgi:hypothetical protein